MKSEAPIEPAAAQQEALRAAYLASLFIRKTLTEAEQEELDNWVTANMQNQEIFERLIEGKNLQEWLDRKNHLHTEQALQTIKKQMVFRPVQRKSIFRPWIYAAAACLLLAALLSLLLVGRKQPAKERLSSQYKTDISAGANRATLVLPDGKKIILDNMRSGQLVGQDNVLLSKTGGGQLVYHSTAPAAAPAYHTLSVPAGGQYALVLSDGTRVWLNAASSLTYPALLNGSKRTVELTGEAYFEVAHQPGSVFEVVIPGGNTVQVLGTHFNLHAYTDEPAMQLVLTEGAVQFNHTAVQPGQEALLDNKGHVTINKTDTATALGWKNGQFIFKETPLELLMRQVARWYNAKVVYAGAAGGHFNATISRNEPVSKLLQLLEATGTVHCSITGNTITVSP